MRPSDYVTLPSSLNTDRAVCVQPQPTARVISGAAELPGGEHETALRSEVTALLRDLGADELRVVAFVARRVAAGRNVYGSLSVAKDSRDWRRERDEELADAIVYSACEALRRDLAGATGGGR